MRRQIGLALLLAAALAGCIGTPGPGADDGTTAAPTTATTTAASTTTATTTTTTEDPPKGSNLLSVTPVSNETVEQVNDSATANFSELDAEEQELFLRAHNGSQVNQDEFRFNDEDRIEYVRYEGQWYYLRVAIV